MNPDLVDRFSAKKRKRKKKMRRTIADVLDPLDLPTMIAAALTQIVNMCCTGRSAQDVRLWHQAEDLKQCKTAEGVARLLFEIGAKYGMNNAYAKIVQLARDPNAYVAFCRTCGQPMADHNDDGSCKKINSVANKDILVGMPGVAVPANDEQP